MTSVGPRSESVCDYGRHGALRCHPPGSTSLHRLLCPQEGLVANVGKPME
jgi:hypothetical protein